MPVKYSEDKGKWCFGENCTFSSKENAEKAEAAYYANMEKKKVTNTDLAKSFNEDKRLFTSIVIKANQYDDDGKNQDFWPEDVVSDAAHDFLLKCMQGNIQHLINTDVVKFVESYIAPVDFPMGSGVVNKGDWVATVKIFDDEIWSMAKEGVFNGFSVGCSALVEIEGEE